MSSRAIYYPDVDRVSNLTASDILLELKTVDGENSGLDADTVDGFPAVQQGSGTNQDINTVVRMGWDNTASKVTLEAGANVLGQVITGDDLAGQTPVSGSMYNPVDTLTDAATIAWDWATEQTAEVTITDNRILSNPTNAGNGEYCSLRVNRTGAFVLSFDTLFKGISDISQSNTSGQIDHFVFRYNGTNFELVSFKANVGA